MDVLARRSAQAGIEGGPPGGERFWGGGLGGFGPGGFPAGHGSAASSEVTRALVDRQRGSPRILPVPSCHSATPIQTRSSSSRRRTFGKYNTVGLDGVLLQRE